MAKPPFRVKAVYEYSSPHDDDLSFPNDQVITVTEEEDIDWYYGEYEDTLGVKHKGLFPRNFVKNYEPETPPRPSRLSRSKKELETPLLPKDDAEDGRLGPSGPVINHTSVPITSSNEAPKNEERISTPSLINAQAAKSPSIPTALPQANMANKPALPTTTKPAQPAQPLATEKPTIGSFRDRINAFNKPTAAPVAPLKPSSLGSSGGSSFVKKPFVAPPPSKNAYVPPPRDPPPQKVYRREEDPEIVASLPNNTEVDEGVKSLQISGLVEEEDSPKPTSLKDRIALLQKQQMEQAARHAEGAQKKEKPKRPPKKRLESHEPNLDHGGQGNDAQLERTNTGETLGKVSSNAPHEEQLAGARPITKSHKSRDSTPVASPITAPPRDLLSDANDADQSGAGDTEDGEEISTGRDDSDDKPPKRTSTVPQISQQPPAREADVGDEEDTVDEEEEADEEELDPEVKRRMEIRERMAKMSGGMGMAGMFGPAGGISPIGPKKQSSVSSERKLPANSTPGATDSPVSKPPPVPMVPIPGLHRVKSPTQEIDPVEAAKDEAESPQSIVRSRDPGEVPDVEDLLEEPIPPSQRSTERAVPPPVPQGKQFYSETIRSRTVFNLNRPPCSCTAW